VSQVINHIWNRLSIALILTALVVAAPVQAATVTSANDYPSTLEAGEDANHTLIFTTPSGVAEGETVTIAFESDFDTSSLTEDDVDVEDDGIDLGTASDCLGADEASVSIAGDTVTITICPGNGGAIAPTSEVTVEIGDTATSSGIGANLVTNPVSAGTYFISIDGTFGDSGSIALPIGGDKSVLVRAIVDQVTGGTGGGGGDGGGCDVNAPDIENLLVFDITDTSATVSFQTDELARTQIDYGVTSSYEIGSRTDENLRTSHEFDLTGLLEGTEYHFQVSGTDTCGNTGVSGDQTFSTVDLSAPVISNVQVVDVTDTTARITWDTNEPADSRVDYGLTDSYGSVESESGFTVTHSILLTGLTPGTVYHFSVTSTDASGNAAQTDDATFTTLSDAPPANVSGLVATAGDAECGLSWTNPTDEDLAGIRVLQCTDTFPSSPTDPDCIVVSDSLATSVLDSGLTNDTQYFYGVFAYDNAQQFASGALASCTPSAPEEELPEEPEEPEEPVVTPPEPTEPQEPRSPPPPPGEVPDVTGEPVLPSEDRFVESDQVEFYVAAGTIQLFPTNAGVIDLLADRFLRIQLRADDITGDVERVQLTLGTDTYLMSANQDGSAYVADVLTPETLGSQDLIVSIQYTDETFQRIPFVANLLGEGFVMESFEGAVSRISGAQVTLREGSGSGTVWDGSPYLQFNPFTTGPQGLFAWYVPNGNYHVRAEKAGYEAGESGTITIVNNIVNPIITLTRTPIPPEDEVTEPGTQPENIIGFIVESVRELLETIREIPGVEEAAVASLPILGAAAVAVLTSLALSFGLWPLLQYLFTSPILFFWRRKRKAFGVVYNAISKTPLDLAIVRLYQLPSEGVQGIPETGKLIRSRVTDKGGRYFFLVQPGHYRIETVKPEFIFPSDYLKNEKTDGSYLDIYHGETIQVTEKDAVITANIPMDPSQAAEFHVPAKIRRTEILRKVQHGVAVIGILASLIFAIIRPTPLSIGMVVLQVVVYLLVRRLAVPKKPKSWGIVYDKQTGRPLARAIVRVFEPKYNKLLETQVTDSRGRYTFLLGPNEYYSVYEKEGYAPQEVRPIDYKTNEEPKELSHQVALPPEGADQIERT